MVLQGIGERPMPQRATVEIGAQGQDQADVGAGAGRQRRSRPSS